MMLRNPVVRSRLLACGVLWLATLTPACTVVNGQTQPTSTAATQPVKAATPSAAGKAGVAQPRNLQDLRDIERQVRAMVKRASAATVGVNVGSSQGSGVIVTPDGFVLTAAHVAVEPNLQVTLVLPDGKRIKAKTLGMNRGIDAGLMQITDPAPEGGWPYVEMGGSADLKNGQWVAALGHPGGFRRDRPPVLRIGRVLTRTNSLIVTDSTLVGGDSGGPLFDLDAKVIGIHSRIGNSTLSNIHVPVDSFAQTWERLAKSEVWGDRFGGGARGPLLGVLGEASDNGFKIDSITPDSPAAKAGIRAGDVITALDGTPIGGTQNLAEMLAKRKAGDEVKVGVTRGEEKLELKATLARRPS